MACCIWVCCDWTWRWFWVDRLCGLLLFWLYSLVGWFLSFVFACGMVGWCAYRVGCGFGLGDLAVRGYRCNLFAGGLLSRISCAIVCVVGDFGFVDCGLILVCGCALVVLRVPFAFT